ncbi:Shedu anti-phage system protein SduA domain-containing protein [Variovorax boronicumulans]|uniref:Shedu anti-phage system protein SduA domain-containing protein n=1 Tax=Variovorax boronicumulans TaxID=436515 RepID=UPI00339260C1
MQKEHSRRLPSTPILGVLRRHLLLEISGGEERVPNSEEIRNWRLEQYRINPDVADMYESLLLVKKDLVFAEMELPELSVALDLLPMLEERPLPRDCFLSVTLKEGDVRGVLMQRQRLKVGGWVYAITIFTLDTKFNAVSRAELRAFAGEPEPFIVFLTAEGWIHFTRAEASQDARASFVIRCLAAQHQFRYQKIPIDQIEIGSANLVPPTKGVLDRLLIDAYKNKIPCTKILIGLDLIELEDTKFALQIPSEIIKDSMSHVADTGNSLELLLYERDGRLVSGDDYLIYLAYRALLVKEVPAVVIGAFNRKGIKIVREGFSELMPPVGVQRGGVKELRVVDEDDQLRLQQKLAIFAPPTPTSTDRLEALYIAFTRLLADSQTAEKDLHNFIAKNPAIVDSYLASIYSEVQIGSYRADLVVRYEQLDKRVWLVELERHDEKIFKKSNRLRHKINHAVQQVEDWIQAIRKGAKPMPGWLDGSFVPEGAVVVGRRKDLTSEQVDTLFNINLNRAVKIITYDDLLERLKRLIEMLGKQGA